MEFVFRSRDRAGQIKSGKLHASSQSEALLRLTEQDLFIIDIREDRKGLWSWLREERGGRHHISRRDVQGLMNDLGQLLRSGIRIDAGLSLVAEMSSRESVREVVEALRRDLRAGGSFADSCAKHPKVFTGPTIAAFRAAEQTGRLEAALARLSQSESQILEFREKLVSSLTYPALLLTMVVLIFALVVFVVIPEFTPLFEMAGDKLPTPTKMLVALCNGIRGPWGFVGLIALALALTIAVAALINPASRRQIDENILKTRALRAWLLPPDLIRAAETLGASLSVGVTLDTALRLAGESVKNICVRNAFDEASNAVRRGQSCSAFLQQQPFLPPLFLHFVRIGEETGELGRMCSEVAAIITRSFQKRLDNLLAILPPVITLGLGGLVAALVGSLLYGMISLNYAVL